jgi:general secretion pathway protein F
MPKFQYSAIRGDGERVSGEIEGANRSVVIGRLGEQGLHPIDVKFTEPAVIAGRIFSFGGGAVSFKEISVFTRELAWLLNAGISLNNALDILAKEAFTSAFSIMIGTLRTEIRKGKSFREALAQTGLFSQYYLSMVEVGEVSGSLASVLERIAVTRDREQKIRNRLASSLTYPALLVTLAFAAVVFIMVSVVPSIKDMILGSGAPIPESAEFVIRVSDWIIANGLMTLIIVPLVVILFILVGGSARIYRLSMAVAMRLPLIGSLLTKTAVVQFSRVLGTLLAAGVSLPDSLKLMRPSTANRQVAEVLAEMETALRQGEDFLAPLDNAKFFPRLLARMLRVGNETGNLTPSVLKATEILEEELDGTIDRTLTLLEPAIILALSSVVAFIITSLMGAIISINDLAL